MQSGHKIEVLSLIARDGTNGVGPFFNVISRRRILREMFVEFRSRRIIGSNHTTMSNDRNVLAKRIVAQELIVFVVRSSNRSAKRPIEDIPVNFIDDSARQNDTALAIDVLGSIASAIDIADHLWNGVIQG